MQFTFLPLGSSLHDYEQQAIELFDAWRAGDPRAIQIFREHHPRFLDERIQWLSKDLSDAEILAESLDIDAARLAVARCYSIQYWSRLVEWIDAIARKDSLISKFESAVEVVITGDVSTLEQRLSENPELVKTRSTLVTCHDPPVHGATLLHYVAANGVEGFRQKTPPNAVDVAKLLLKAGAEVDALAGMYGEQATTMSMLVSSSHPAEIGLQIPLAELLLDSGAAIEGRGTGVWVSPLMTALAFGFTETAEALVRRGARVDTAAAAAGLGRLAVIQKLLPNSSSEDRHRALALAAQHGHVDIVQVLLDAGENPNRYNPKGNHDHSTPLHQAVWSGHDAVVRLLVERGASLQIKDTIYQGTPLGWAEYGKRTKIADYLRTQSPAS